MNVSLIRPPRADKPSTQVPGEDFLHRGFGFIQIAHSQWDRRIAAATGISMMLRSGQLPADAESIQIGLSIVRDMFFRVHTCERYDWYTTSKFLGHPSGDLCKTLATQVGIMKGALRTQDPLLMASATAVFADNFGLDMLDNYLDMAVRSAHPVKEEGWAYILWSSSEKDVLHMGAAGGEIEEVTASLNAENPEYHPYGVLAAWLVHDPVDAYQTIHAAFEGEALGGGFFRTDLATARKRIDAALKMDDNFALSPWHDYEPTLEAEQVAQPARMAV